MLNLKRVLVSKSVGKPGSVNGDLGILIITPRLTALMTGQLPKVRTLLRNKDLIAGLGREANGYRHPQ